MAERLERIFDFINVNVFFSVVNPGIMMTNNVLLSQMHFKLFDKFFQKQSWQIIAIAIITVLVYSNSLFNGLVWDDHLFLESWPDINSLDQIPSILKGSAPPGQGKIFRPLRGVLYALEYQFFNANPFPYHLQALLIHLSITVLVYFVTLKIIQNLKLKSFKKTTSLLPFLTSLFFGLHPIHTETINYISASMETFGTLFFFLSFYFYLRFKKIWISLLFAALAFFTYEMTLTLPVLILLYDFCFKFKSLKELKSLKILKKVSPYFILAVAFLFIRVFVFKIVARQDYLGYSFYLTMLTMVKVFARYALLLIFPFNQTAIHNLAGDFPSSMLPYDKLDPILNQNIFDFPVLVSLGVLGMLGLLGIRARKKYPLITFGIFWFFISLIPVSYIIPHGGAMAEKYLYIASFGYVLLLAWGILWASGKIINIIQKSCLAGRQAKFKMQNYNSKLKSIKTFDFLPVLLTFAFCILTFYSFQTFRRNQVWKDDISLFSDVVKKSPDNLIANYTLGVWYGKLNQLDQAEERYKVAINKAPDFIEARYNLGNIYMRKANFDLAEEQYTHLVKFAPNSYPSQNILKNINLLKNNPSSTTLNPNLFRINYKSGNLELTYSPTFLLSDSKDEINLKGPDGNFSVTISLEDKQQSESPEEFLKTQKQQYGELLNQGGALIPNFDNAYVKVFDGSGVKKLQFFLFKGVNVVKVLVYPGDSPEMKEFDIILGSIGISPSSPRR